MKKIILLVFGSLLLWSCQQEKTAYVDTNVLHKNYNALVAKNKQFQKKQQSIQAKLRINGQKFQKEVQAFQAAAKSMSKKEQAARRDALLSEQQQLRQAQNAEIGSMRQQQDKTQDSLEQIIKENIKAYAQAHNYTYVFGNGDDNSILYAETGKNITQEILKKLNGSADETASATTKSTPKKTDSLPVK